MYEELYGGGGDNDDSTGAGAVFSGTRSSSVESVFLTAESRFQQEDSWMSQSSFTIVFQLGVLIAIKGTVKEEAVRWYHPSLSLKLPGSNWRH